MFQINTELVINCYCADRTINIIIRRCFHDVCASPSLPYCSSNMAQLSRNACDWSVFWLKFHRKQSQYESLAFFALKISNWAASSHTSVVQLQFSIHYLGRWTEEEYITNLSLRVDYDFPLTLFLYKSHREYYCYRCPLACQLKGFIVINCCEKEIHFIKERWLIPSYLLISYISEK